MAKTSMTLRSMKTRSSSGSPSDIAIGPISDDRANTSPLSDDSDTSIWSELVSKRLWSSRIQRYACPLRAVGGAEYVQADLPRRAWVDNGPDLDRLSADVV